MKYTNKNSKITVREEKFCSEYVLRLNATQAAINAGYSKKTAKEIGYENLTKPHIQTEISRLRKSLGETAEISALKVLKELKEIAFSDAGQLYDDWLSLKEFEDLTPGQKAAISEIETKTNRYGTTVRVKLFDKQKALEAISRMLGYDSPAQTQVTGKNGTPLLPEFKFIDLLNKLPDDELEQYHKLLCKAQI